MRRLAASLLALLLAGCAAEGDGDPADAGEDPARQSDLPQEPDLAVPGVPGVSVHNGTLAWGVRPPLGMVASGPHERFQSTSVDLAVPDDVTALLLELTWDAGPGPRPTLVLRALSGSEHYWYGGGEGTAGDPAWVAIEDPEDAYEVTAIADLAEADVAWTLHATAFRGGGVPDGYSALA